MNKYLKKLIWFTVFFSLFLIFDLLLKHFYFNSAGLTEASPTGSIQENWTVLGIRSNAHFGSTILDLFHVSISHTWSVVMFVGIAAMFLAMMLFANNKVALIAFSIALAGIFGNGLDVVYKGFVRNIFFMPWHDSGTFNFADVLIVTAAPIAAVATMWTAFKK